MPFDIPHYTMKPEEASSFVIRPVLREVDPEQLQETPHRHTYHEIIWMRSGSGKHRIDDELIEITPTTFYWIKQGQVHDFQKGTDLDGLLIRFTNHFLPYDPHTALSTSLISQFQNQNAFRLRPEEIPAYERILQALLVEYEGDKNTFGRTGVLQHLLMALLIMLERRSRASSMSAFDRVDDPDRQIFQRFIHLLEEHFRAEHQVGFYASQLGVNNRKLSAICKRYAGLTAKQLILECLLREARRSLAYTHLTLNGISYRLGFRDTAYFCRLFKRHTGKTPQQYKDEVRV